MKKGIILLAMFLLCGCEENKLYVTDLSDQPYYVCGEEFYVSDYVYSNKILMKGVLEVVEERCKEYYE